MNKWIEFRGSRRRMALVLTAGGFASVALLWAAFRKVSFDQMAEAFDGAHWGWLPVALVVMLVSMIVRAERWRLLFDDRDKLTLRLSFASTNIGVLFNNLLPQRAGELARIIAVNRGSGISRLETAATVIAERLVDVFTLGAIGLAFWPWLPDTRWVFVIRLVCIAAVAGPLLVIAGLSGFRRHVPGLVQRLLHRLPRVGHERSHQFTASLASGARVLLKPHRLLAAVGLGFLAWGLMGLASWILLHMFDFHIDSVPAIALVVVAVNFAVAIPVGPGAVGVYEAATQASLVAFGISHSDALSYAVVSHAMVFFPFVLLGLLGMLTVRRMGKARAVEPEWSQPDPVLDTPPVR